MAQNPVARGRAGTEGQAASQVIGAQAPLSAFQLVIGAWLHSTAIRTSTGVRLPCRRQEDIHQLTRVPDVGSTTAPHACSTSQWKSRKQPLLGPLTVSRCPPREMGIAQDVIGCRWSPNIPLPCHLKDGLRGSGQLSGHIGVHGLSRCDLDSFHTEPLGCTRRHQVWTKVRTRPQMMTLILRRRPWQRPLDSRRECHHSPHPFSSPHPPQMRQSFKGHPCPWMTSGPNKNSNLGLEAEELRGF